MSLQTLDDLNAFRCRASSEFFHNLKYLRRDGLDFGATAVAATCPAVYVSFFTNHFIHYAIHPRLEILYKIDHGERVMTSTQMLRCGLLHVLGRLQESRFFFGG
jgi:hypothetical protein